jgi:hypothetical protein
MHSIYQCLVKITSVYSGPGGRVQVRPGLLMHYGHCYIPPMIAVTVLCGRGGPPGGMSVHGLKAGFKLSPDSKDRLELMV